MSKTRTETERLLISIDADTARLERKLAAAEKKITGFLSRIDARISKSESKLVRLAKRAAKGAT